MEKMNSRLDKILQFMTYGSLMILALGLVTSTTVLSLSHILIVFPAFYFLLKANYREFPKSAWALLALAIIIILSVVLNQDIAVNGYKPITKTKYFLISFLSIAPFSWYFKYHFDTKKISKLVYAFCIATTFATVVGLISMKTEYNFVTFREVTPFRNSGLFGMTMNYAHNLSYFLILFIGALFYRRDAQSFIKYKHLIVFVLINLIGLYFSYTRGAALGLLVGIIFLFYIYNKKWFTYAFALLLVLSLTLYLVGGERFSRPLSDRERISQWNAAFYAFKERPMLGYGYLNFEKHSSEIKKKYDLGELQFGGHAHNNFLEMLASCGILGLLAYLSWLVLWFIEMYKRNDLIAKISMPLIIVFVVGGLTQSTIALGINLFFVMAVYSVGQINRKNVS